MPSMPYDSMQMPIGWNGLSMPYEGCFVCMPIVITNFKVRRPEKLHLAHFELEAVKEMPDTC